MPRSRGSVWISAGHSRHHPATGPMECGSLNLRGHLHPRWHRASENASDTDALCERGTDPLEGDLSHDGCRAVRWRTGKR